MFTAHHRAATNARVTGGKLELVYTRPNVDEAYAAYATTNGIFGTTYGYFEIRMQVTNQASSQSAFWMMPYVDANGDGRSGLPENNTVTNSAVDGAEIDIMESKNLPNDYSAGIICDNYATSPPPCADTRDNTLSASGFRTGYKTWALNWTPEKMEFIYNGQVKHTLTANNRIVHVPERLILSGAAGLGLKNNLPVGSENNSGKVDWIRVHKDNEMDWGSGYFKIINRHNGKALTAGSNGTSPTQSNYSGSNAQKWQVIKDSVCGADNYAFRAKSNNLYVEALDQPSIAPGGNIQLRMTNVTSMCEWRVDYYDNDDGSDFYNVGSYDPTGVVMYMQVPTSGNNVVQALKTGAATSPERYDWQIVWVED